jgi:Zn-dependent M28 family amino/carboxypeptidase
MMTSLLRAFAASGVVVWCAVVPLVVGAQSPAAPHARDHVRALTSESFDGRAAGTEGERRAAEYLAAQLRRMGARPLPGRRDFFSTFDFTAGSRDGGSRVTVIAPAGGAGGDRVFSGGRDVVALSFSDATEVSGDVVFAGYGIVVPESQHVGYDSYAGLDVKDKIALVLRYFPENADQSTRAILARYADLRYKAMAARQRGAIGLLVVTGPASPNAGETIPMTFDTAIAGSGISAASVSAPVAQSLLGDTSLRALQAALDGGNPHVAGVPTGRRARLAPSVVRQRRTGRNVVGYLPATTPVEGVARPWVAVGAHFDHLGRGAGGNSLAARDEIGRPHVGADDNASGTAAVLAIGEALSTRPRRRHVLLAFWSAEEIGLIGSARFLDGGLVKSAELAAYLNFDMVGRMVDNRLAVQATGTSASWPTLLEQVNVAAGFDLAVQPDPFQPTDVSNFNQAGVPSLSFTTGAHTDYHKPSDTADKINYDDLARIASMATTIATRLMETPEPPLFAKVEQSNQTASRTGLRVFTGTVPDYTSSETGLLLGGVVGGGPAEQAGLRKGDVIVEISGKTIANIYDYTYALELLKVGQPADVTYVRQGERRRTTLTPSARR